MFLANMGEVYLTGGAGIHKEDTNCFCIQDPPRHDIEGGVGGLGPMSNDTRDPLKRQFPTVEFIC